MDVTIRETVVEDLPVIAELCALLGYSGHVETVGRRFAAVRADPRHAVFVAEVGSSDIAGWIHLMPRVGLLSRPLVEIGGLIVSERYRRQGIGRRLVGRAEDWARAHGYEGLIVRSASERPESHHFYPGVGYDFLKDQKVYVRFF